MTRHKKDIRVGYCESCGESFITSIDTKIYCTIECAKREENRRRADRIRALKYEVTHQGQPKLLPPKIDFSKV